jgi:hypothetical protein
MGKGGPMAFLNKKVSNSKTASLNYCTVKPQRQFSNSFYSLSLFRHGILGGSKTKRKYGNVSKKPPKRTKR